MAMFSPTNDATFLIIAPHPDDEAIGVGGLLSAFGKNSDVVILTDGRKGVSPLKNRSPLEISEIRREEALETAKRLEIRSVAFLDIPDQDTKKYLKRVNSVNIHGYDYILIPSRWETHVDHIMAFRTIYKKCSRARILERVLEYEVWNPIPCPNLYFDISEYLRMKKEAVACYGSQLESYDYLKIVDSYAFLRGSMQHCRACEAFFNEKKFKKDERMEKAIFLWGKLPNFVRRFVKKIVKR